MKWPGYDEDALKRDTVEIVVQLNGKVKKKLDVTNNISKEELEKTAMSDADVMKMLENRDIIKIIAVPDKLVNIVVR